MRRGLLLLSGVLLSLLVLHHFAAPWIWLLLAWALVAWRVAASAARGRSSRTTWRALAASLSILCLCEAGVTVLELRERPPPDSTHGEHLYDTVPDEILGSRPPPGTTRRARRFDGDRPIYDAVYTFTEDGLRVTPPCSPRATQAVLFFGGSFAFGEGLDDDQTIPYLTATGIGKNSCVYNFAVHGYGTHHMLAAIEHGLVDAIVEQEPRFVFYLSWYPAHVSRLAGMASWNRHGPMYRLGADGRPRYAGHFDDESPHPVLAALLSGVEKSALGRRLLAWRQRLDDDDKRLFIAAIVESRDRMRARAPDLAFHVIVLGRAAIEADAWVFDALRDAGIPVHLVADIIPDYRSAQTKYILDARDGHPNALADRLIADYLIEQILRD